MTITIDRKRVDSIDLFPAIDDFITLLKREYNNINFDNEMIESSIVVIYDKIINGDGNILYLRFSRWLPSQFGFKHSNKFSLPFWIERGFTKDDYDVCIKDKSEDTKKTQTEFRKKQLVGKIKFDVDYSDLFKFNKTFFINSMLPTCNSCKSDLSVKTSTYLDKPVYLITGCSNIGCVANDVKNKDIRWYSFLPTENYNEIKNKLKSPKAFSKDFWVEKGYSEKEAIDKVFDIQSKNSKKFTGKRTGKSKDILRGKGYTEEQIKGVSLAPSNVDFWVKKGYSEQESKSIISKNQSYAAGFVDFDKRLLPSNVEYWINKGHSLIESKKLVSKSQTTFSKEICIEKYGPVEGIEIFNERTRKWQESLFINGNIKGGYSKISQELFFEIANVLSGDFKFALCNSELCIRENDKNYYFDFFDSNRKKIIEYNGDQYHANPITYNENDCPHPYYRDGSLTAKDIWIKDEFKIVLANNNGYEVLTIWDLEYKENKELIIQKCINFLTNNK